MTYTNIMLTLIPIITGVLAIVTFLKNENKDNKNNGEDAGALKSDIKYIKDILLDVRNETKEINKSLDNHSIQIAKAQQEIININQRVDDAVSRIDALEHSGGVR